MVKKTSFLLLILSLLSYSQSNTFTPHDVFKLKTVGETVVAPNGEYTAFSLRVPRPFDDGSGTAYKELYLYNYSDESITPLITGKVNVDDLSWAHDSRHVSFTAKLNEDKKSQIYLIALDASDTIKVTNAESSIIQYEWQPNSNQLAYIALENISKPKHKELGFGIEVFEENIPGRFLYLLDTESKEATKLNQEGAVFDFAWSPDGKLIAAAIAPNNLVDDSYMFKNIHIIDVETKNVEELIDNPGKLGKFAWGNDSKHIAFISAADKNDAVDGSLFAVEVPNNKKFEELRNYSKNFIGSVTDIDWLDSETMLFTSEEGVYTTLRKQKIDSENSSFIIKPNKAVFKSFNKSEDKIVFSGETPSYPSELFTYDMDSEKLQRNTFHNKWIEDKKLAKQDVIEYKASDGLTIEGLLFYPLNFEEDKRYPLITYVHGGPEATNSYGWNTGYNRWGQSAAAKDFFVFMPNYRAGSGRGNEFTMMGFADAGGREFDDVLDGINYLAKKGYIDKNRVGIGGGSYGGYFSAWAASKHSEHFAAAVSFVGIGNQLVKRNTTDIPWESYLVHWGYWVNEDPMAVYDRSPVKYAEKMNTPLLILHGTKDPRVHPSQSLEMYRAFKLRGKAPVRLVWYEGEGHGNSKNTNRLDYHLRTLEWFEYYLKGDKHKNKMPSNEVEYNLDYFDN